MKIQELPLDAQQEIEDMQNIADFKISPPDGELLLVLSALRVWMQDKEAVDVDWSNEDDENDEDWDDEESEEGEEDSESDGLELYQKLAYATAIGGLLRVDSHKLLLPAILLTIGCTALFLIAAIRRRRLASTTPGPKARLCKEIG